MNPDVQGTQVTPVNTPGCSSACADNSAKATPTVLSGIERKWSWIIVAASFWNQFVVCGILQVLGLYNVEFLEAFKDSKSKTAWITSVAGAFVLGLGPLVALILNRTSARLTACLGGVISTLGLLMSWFASSAILLSITFGAIMGSGLCMVFLSSTVIVGQHFQKRRAFTTALCSCGGSLGSLLLPVYATYLIKEYTWRGSLFLLAALCFQTMVFSCLLRPAPNKDKTETIEVRTSDPKPNHKQGSATLYTVETSETLEHVDPSQGFGRDVTGSHSVSCSENRTASLDGCVDSNSCNIRSSDRALIITLMNKILQNPLNNMGMLLYCIASILGNIGAGFVIITLPDFIYISLGAKDISAVMLMCIAAGRIGGGIIASGLGNWKPLHCLHMNCASNVLMGIVTFFYTLSANTYVFGVLSCLFGIGMGATIAWITQVTVNLVGTKNLVHAIGYVLAARGVGWLIGPPLGGVLFDIGDGYLLSFWMAAAAMVAGGLLPVIALLRERNTKPDA